MVGGARPGDDADMNYARAALIATVAVSAGAGAASAGGGRGRLVVPVVGEHGGPVYCTHNLSPDAAAPIDGGGYRISGLDDGRYVVRIELPHEKIDILTVVAGDGEVIVPPVVARGRCRSIEVVARAATPTDSDAPTWSLRYGRRYSQRAAPRLADVTWRPAFRHPPKSH